MKRLIFISALYALAPCLAMGQQQPWVWLNPYPIGLQINQVYFLNPAEGFLLGDAGTLLRTTDAGNTWRQVDVPQEVFFFKVVFPTFYFVRFSSPTVGLALGRSYYQYGPVFIVAQTTNGGDS